MLDITSLQLLSGAAIAALSALAGVHSVRSKERSGREHLPIETVQAAATHTEAAAKLTTAQTEQLASLFQQLNSLSARLDLEMQRSTTLQAEMLDLRKWAGKKLQLKDDQIAELKLRIQHLEQHNLELQTKLDRESRLAVSEDKARALIEVAEVKAEKLAHADGTRLKSGKEKEE